MNWRFFFDAFPEGIMFLPGYPHNFTSLSAPQYQIMLGSILFQSLLGHYVLPIREADIGLAIVQYAKRVQFPHDHRDQGRYKPKMDHLEQQRLFLLEGLINCVEKKSEVLLKQFPIPFELFHTIMHNSEQITQFKGFGPEFITTNTRLLQQIFDHDLQEDA